MSVLVTLGIFTAVLTIGVLVSDHEKKDREKNPEKWAKIDAEEWSGEATKYWKMYSKTIKRIPRSEWILMSREEKSHVFKQRENLKSQYEKLPDEVKKIIQQQFSVDLSFKDSN